MATIISMSLNEKILDEVDELVKEMGFSGRSEAIRAGVRLLSHQQKERAKMVGIIHATLSIIHQHSHDITPIVHEYQDIIKTHLHNHLENHSCLDVFVLKGDAEKVKKLVNGFETNKKVQSVKLSIC